MTRSPDFQYAQRWPVIGKQFPDTLSSELIEQLDQRDRDLEDYLPGVEPGAINSVALWGSGGSYYIPFDETNPVNSDFTERADSGSGSDWTLTDRTYLTVPAGIYLVTGQARFLANPGSTAVTLGLVVTAGFNQYLSSETVVADEDDPEVYLSLATPLYLSTEGDIYLGAVVFSGGDVGIPTQSFRDRTLCVMQLSTSAYSLLV